jgi:hypothetical protein
MAIATNLDAERRRLAEGMGGNEGWRLWGPFLSDRQRATVREDYSPSGNAWEYFPHDHARSRVYRWGEDGSWASVTAGAGCALPSPSLFGLTGDEGNHGEDVKECYFYVDATPTSSYLKGFYKYPQAGSAWGILDQLKS